MKDLVVSSMIFSMIVGFLATTRLMFDTKWAFLLLVLYSIGALCVFMIVVMMYGPKPGIDDGAGVGRYKDKMYIQRDSGKNTPVVDVFI
jgi:hypothetical protein